MASTGLTGSFVNLSVFENGLQVYKSFKDKFPEIGIPDSMKYEQNAIDAVLTLYNCLRASKSFGVQRLITLFPQIDEKKFKAAIGM